AMEVSMKLASANSLRIVLALLLSASIAPFAHADAPMSIVEEAGAWKVILGGPIGVYVVTITDQAALGIVPAENGLYLYANVPDAGLQTISVQFDGGMSYTLAVQ